jgi:hypothetical protein
VPIAPVTSHAAHWPVHAELQHTPSTQKPDVHCVAPPQDTPSASRATHRPALHQLPFAQSRSVTQSPAHVLTPQPKGAHA